MSKSLNKAQLIGNITKDPVVTKKDNGTTFCYFSVATNRNWKTSSGEEKEDTEFIKIVAWDKLADLCAQLLKKGTRVYIEGRIHTSKFTGTDGSERESVEIVATEMIVLSSKDISDSSTTTE